MDQSAKNQRDGKHLLKIYQSRGGSSNFWIPTTVVESRKSEDPLRLWLKLVPKTELRMISQKRGKKKLRKQ